MKSLQSLVIDRHFGELSPKEAKALEARLAAEPAARAEAEKILATLATVRRTVLTHPELVKSTGPAVAKMSFFVHGNWLALAAAAVFLVALSGSVGFWAGRTFSKPLPGIAQATDPVEKSPWTRYRIASNPGAAGFQIVRLENQKAN
jgi:anti-sigma factor RsiW